MNDWPFSAREMTIVHFMFVTGCGAELERLREERMPGAKRSFTMTASRSAALDRAFTAMQARGERAKGTPNGG